MAEIKRKTQSSGFEAGEEPFKALESAETLPDFSALEAESGFSAGQEKESFQALEPAAAPAETVIEPAKPIERRAEPEIERIAAEPAREEPAKKRYYSPGEVMKKKGCIGCGGMALVLPVMLALIALAVTLF